jgi:hypothetical protein
MVMLVGCLLSISWTEVSFQPARVFSQKMAAVTPSVACPGFDLTGPAGSGLWAGRLI